MLYHQLGTYDLRIVKTKHKFKSNSPKLNNFDFFYGYLSYKYYPVVKIIQIFFDTFKKVKLYVN